jgi:hypothetical protein
VTSDKRGVGATGGLPASAPAPTFSVLPTAVVVYAPYANCAGPGIIGGVNRTAQFGLAAVLALYAVMAALGITWGLPTAQIDPLLFGDGPPWSGEQIARLSNTAAKFAGARGADVDADPIRFAGQEPVDLTATEADVAAIYRRYRLFTHQPDEMITMMALAGMRPRAGNFDPKLYQYGGLFIYPVGACIAAGGAVGAIHVTSDLTYYLDHPDDFGRFYVAARGYVALWGAVGVVLVYAIAARLAGWQGRPPQEAAPSRCVRTGLLAAALFALLPVVVCMSHEAKPHLPGAVLMLAAVWQAMRYVEGGHRRDWIGLCVACGAAFGMVLSALPIFVLIPLAEWLRRRREEKSNCRNREGEAPAEPPSLSTQHSALSTSCATRQEPRLPLAWRRVIVGVGLGLAVYVVTNPYVAINAVANRAVLQSNLRNSTAMYEIGRVGEGLVRVVELTIDGATLPVLVLGAAGLCVLAARRESMPLVVPAVFVFVQFVLLGAGKPAEYGRFGVFCNAALAIGTACLVGRCGVDTAGGRRPGVRGIAAAGLIVLCTGYFGAGYLHNFRQDAQADNTRSQFGPELDRCVTRDPRDGRPVVCVLADPAPYGLPPMNFAQLHLWRYPSLAAYQADPRGVLVLPADTNPPRRPQNVGLAYCSGTGATPFSPISWANKPMMLWRPPTRQGSDPSVER